MGVLEFVLLGYTYGIILSYAVIALLIWVGCFCAILGLAVAAARYLLALVFPARKGRHS